MKYDKFVLTQLSDFSLLDYKNLRTYYSPMIGSEATFVFQILADNTHQEHEIHQMVDDLLINYQITREVLNKSLDKLAAVGLIMVKEHHERKLSWIQLGKISNFEELCANPTLKAYLTQVLGEVRFQNLYSKSLKIVFNDLGFIANSKSFNQVFGPIPIKKLDDLDVFNTLEINLEKTNFETYRDAAKALSTFHFYQYITKNRADSGTRSALEEANKVLDQSITNLIINYIYTGKGNLTIPYFKTIVKDYSSRSSVDFNAIADHFENILFAKKIGQTNQPAKPSIMSMAKLKPKFDSSKSIVNTIETSIIDELDEWMGSTK